MSVLGIMNLDTLKSLTDPHDIKPHEGSLRQSAAQMWLLATVLPFIIGDLIPESEKHWCCFLLLLKICSIAAAWSLNVNTVSYLSIIIEEHHELFGTLYPARTIIPKMHYMVHYPSQIQKLDPSSTHGRCAMNQSYVY